MLRKIVYNHAFYEEQGKVNIRSSEIIYPILNDIIMKKVYSVCDVGCGTGCWLKVFKEHGCHILGIDGNPYMDTLQIDKNEFLQHDFRKPLEIEEKFDLAISLEVAEHLPEKMADQFIGLLTSLSDYVLFSAAIPNQLGQGHINEQWQSYWVRKFRKYGYEAVDCIRPVIWDNKDVAFYYKQNLLLYVRKMEATAGIINQYGGVYDMVHPELWERIQKRYFVKIIGAMYNNPYIYRIYQCYKKWKGRY